MYLHRKRVTKKTRVHIWTGFDTACRMYSTGGLRPEKYQVSKTDMGLSTCLMCANAVASGRKEAENPLDQQEYDELDLITASPI